ncbi:lanthionine synthetase C family protein [Tumebacillus algifaecis]|nr:lanthionine synthetase C family protein [Tumebacillus algifaecis]
MTTKKLQWQPIESEQLRNEVERTVRLTAERLKEATWEHDASLAGGAAGLCLLYGALDHLFPEEGWDLIGHQSLIAIQQRLQTAGVPNLSLWSGLSGTVLAVQALSRGGERYQKMQASLLHSLLEQLPAHIEEARSRIANELRITDYDAVLGLAGIGRVLLAFADREEVRAALHEVLSYLVTLSGEKEAHGTLVPAWHIHSHLHMREDEFDRYPQGSFNLGLSHGIAGPLATLSLALLQGVEIPGQREAIQRFGAWIEHYQTREGNALLWPGRVSFESWQSGHCAEKVHTPYSWCYGAPGIGRAMWLAGKALDHTDWKEAGIAAYLGVADRIDSQWDLCTPNICHGWGGLLHLVQRMYAETGLAELAPCRDELARRVLDSFSEQHPYGFNDPASTTQHKPELLEGASGVALTLLSLLAEDAPEWDMALLIS